MRRARPLHNPSPANSTALSVAEAAFAPYNWDDPLKVHSTMLTEDEVAIMSVWTAPIGRSSAKDSSLTSGSQGDREGVLSGTPAAQGA